jgi:hypothetical protein
MESKPKTAYQLALEELIDKTYMVRDCVELGEFKTVNDAIKAKFYHVEGHTDLRTFEKWKEAGFIIRKGSKGFSVWGPPVPMATLEEMKQGKNYPMYRVQFLFSQKQVFKKSAAAA